MKLGSLFAGIGGFDLAAERAGIHVVWQVEINAKRRSVLARHFPTVRRLGNIKFVHPDELEPVDIIAAGFPCQSVSVAGTRTGLAGQSGLFFEIVRIARGLVPRWLLLENVPGLLSCRGGRDFAEVLRSLAQLGYSCAWRVFDARGFGLPQQRYRVFLVADYRGPAGPFQVLFESDHCPQHLTPGRKWLDECAKAALQGSGTDSIPAWSKAVTTSVQRFDPTMETMMPVFAPTIVASMIRFLVPYKNTVRKPTPLEMERLQGFPDNWTRWGADGKELADGVRYRALGDAVPVPVVEWILRRIKMVHESG
jgi:DNA (cytosine-5)-methyltransferase 1